MAAWRSERCLNMNTDFIKGVIVPILTPIDEEENIDEKKLREQVDYVIEGGVLGILAFGSNGEFYVIEEDEMERGLTIMVDQAAGRVPVYFGIGAISTKKCCHLAKMAVANGAAGISVLQPMFLKPTESEPVSYTHLDVYKRQSLLRRIFPHSACSILKWFRKRNWMEMIVNRLHKLYPVLVIKQIFHDTPPHSVVQSIPGFDLPKV